MNKGMKVSAALMVAGLVGGSVAMVANLMTAIEKGISLTK